MKNMLQAPRSGRTAKALPAKGTARRSPVTRKRSSSVKRPGRAGARLPWNERASFVLYAEEHVTRTKPGGAQKIVMRIVCHHLESGRQRSWQWTHLTQLPAWIGRMLGRKHPDRPDAPSSVL